MAKPTGLQDIELPRYEAAAELLAEAAKQQGANDHGLAKLSGVDGQWCANLHWNAGDRLFTINLGTASGYGDDPLVAVEDCLRHAVNQREKSRRNALTLDAQYQHQSALLRERLKSL